MFECLILTLLIMFLTFAILLAVRNPMVCSFRKKVLDFEWEMIELCTQKQILEERHKQ